jgi:hypothetical protein
VEVQWAWAGVSVLEVVFRHVAHGRPAGLVLGRRRRLRLVLRKLDPRLHTRARTQRARSVTVSRRPSTSTSLYILLLHLPGRADRAIDAPWDSLSVAHSNRLIPKEIHHAPSRPNRSGVKPPLPCASCDWWGLQLPLAAHYHHFPSRPQTTAVKNEMRQKRETLANPNATIRNKHL